MPVTPSAATQAPFPEHVGKYELLIPIGTGGMATVYLGRDVRDDGSERLVALKVIREEYADDEEFAAMFVDEAKILARLSHPNVIQTFEYGVTDAKAVGMSLYGPYVIGVELSGILLMSGIVGAYHLGRKKKKVVHRYLEKAEL